MNVAVGDKSEEENEEEGNIGQEGEGNGEVLNQVEEKLFRVIAKLMIDLKLTLACFWEI